MPWTPKQNELFRAVAHGWKKPGGGGPSVSAARKMEHEGIKGGKHERAAKRKKHLDKWARGEREHSNVSDYKT